MGFKRNEVVKLASLFLVIMTFYINLPEGLKWISEPLPVNKCKGQTANFTWEYEREPDEDVSQHQWIFNRTELIASNSLTQGFNVEPKYQGRVSQSGNAGILLHNISSIDSGNYTLYPLVKWEEKPNIQTVQLNVIVSDCVNDPSTLCVPISNQTNQDTNEDNKLINLIHNQHHILISIFVIFFVGFCVTIIMHGVLIREIQHLKNKKLIINSGTVDLEHAQEFQSLNN